jgi:phenylalanine-4-hydroxylase
MVKPKQYSSKQVDSQGKVKWDQCENDVWSQLITTQIKHIQGVACIEYLEGLKALNLPLDRIPQLPEINEILSSKTGWQIEAVPSLIKFDRFFELLSLRLFPCATFIRTQQDINYLREPDIFHEIFGHCPMLTDPYFADFTARYGRLGFKASHKERVMLARLYWFTVEFGIIKRNNQFKLYGGGILSSISETDFCLSSDVERSPLKLLDVFRTPYRIDIMQPVYYFIEKFADFENLTEEDIMNTAQKASELGLFEPKYASKSA